MACTFNSKISTDKTNILFYPQLLSFNIALAKELQRCSILEPFEKSIKSKNVLILLS
jgi:hypothetical protein